MPRKRLFSYLSKNLLKVLGIVLIWRGVWYILDGMDKWLFNGNPIITVLGGIILGVLILYLPDKDLKELEKL